MRQQQPSTQNEEEEKEKTCDLHTREHCQTMAAHARRRVPVYLRQTVRRYYRNAIGTALVGVTLVALFAGERSVARIEEASATQSQSWHVPSRSLLAAAGGEAKMQSMARRALPAQCSDFTETKQSAWQDACCVYPPAEKDQLEDWWKACRNTQYLSGNPYLACLSKWYEPAKDKANNATGGVASLKAHCSDMGVYQSLGLDIAEIGFDYGMVVPYLGFLLYMFVALAIVCDEYFVPAIDEITEAFGITPDVAGATLMAAGGSAPELATSFMGVFVSKSDVGFSTIVGSAVCHRKYRRADAGRLGGLCRAVPGAMPACQHDTVRRAPITHRKGLKHALMPWYARHANITLV